jgi:hypothetical protein
MEYVVMSISGRTHIPYYYGLGSHDFNDIFETDFVIREKLHYWDQRNQNLLRIQKSDLHSNF